MPGWTEVTDSLARCAPACVCNWQPALVPVVTDTRVWGLYLEMHEPDFKIRDTGPSQTWLGHLFGLLVSAPRMEVHLLDIVTGTTASE